MDAIPNYGWAAAVVAAIGLISAIIAGRGNARKRKQDARAAAKQAALDALDAGDVDGAVDALLRMPND